MRQKTPVNQDLNEDENLWKRVTQDVLPLAKPRLTSKYQSTLAQPLKPSESFHRELIKTDLPICSHETSKLEIKPVDLRKGESAGLDRRTQRRLYRGDISIERRLDLHGFTASRAEVILQSFIQDAAGSGCRCVLVITGKGAGILRCQVPIWLKREPISALVLALAEARPSDGGTGALYVLLRRRR